MALGRKYDDFAAGKKSSFLVTAKDLGRIVRVDLEWRPDPPQQIFVDQNNNQVYGYQGSQADVDRSRLYLHYVRVLNLATGERWGVEEPIRSQLLRSRGTAVSPELGAVLYCTGHVLWKHF